MSKRLPEISTVKKCPYCGSTEGILTYWKVSGHSVSYYSFDGSFVDNSEMYSGLRETPPKLAKCINCERNIGRVEEGSLDALRDREKQYRYQFADQ